MRGALAAVQSGGHAGEWPWALWEWVREEEGVEDGGEGQGTRATPQGACWKAP